MYNFMQNGESALHSAAKEGISSVVQNMCAYGCQVDVVSKVCANSSLR